ncbi:AcrR family transcriptional regulator [Mycolicibacterium sp. BK556]|uniref:TetR family transcriptional regulator n=1 Tax=Mycobacteriaceae TaxID=1762 RepID=UPI0010606FAE|nr:TetR family transcriptional regulator [Mycobacterium sp. BK086]MBB3605914.1 AcrR family transcriptional regulator [Mycolicibacterium sp. BK556]MBB3632491.1 AcrR family transcriptional regulator [Mycolicibacterium sp. BK607]MBB3753887.1 AcrR family transcriptional regulator [Mycolicibacterium sp. BK634]TDO18220.1 TetR family transcriptional regulator [Mycobacterium sp. BK086]
MDSAEKTTGTAVGTRDRILDIVVDILENEGYDAVQLREVARRSRTSLATIYKRYPTRDHLILAALESWMDEHRYAGLARQHHEPGESIYDGLMRVLGTIFEPWERHPEMLKAYYRSRASTGRELVLDRGLDSVIPAAMEVLGGVDESFVADLDSVVATLVFGLSGRFAAGEIAITDILPTIERTVRWFTTGYEATRN